jgi:hypothetical protein
MPVFGEHFPAAPEAGLYARHAGSMWTLFILRAGMASRDMLVRAVTGGSVAGAGVCRWAAEADSPTCRWLQASPGADVCGGEPVPAQMWAAVSPVLAQMWQACSESSPVAVPVGVIRLPRAGPFG